MADGLLINGRPSSTSFTVQGGELYMFRVSNVALTTSVNFRIQGHTLTLVETEGSHKLQEAYESFDLHVGQSASFLVKLHAPVKDYFIVASTRFTKPTLTAAGILHYDGSQTETSLPLPIGPTYQIHWSMKQARTIRWNMTANAARPNPQGSYHYGTIPVTRRVVLANSEANINGKLSFGSVVWNSTLRRRFYNLNDATTRHTVQVYPKSWSAILVSLDNKGMWNLRSTIWPRRYLGQELYIRVWNDEKSFHNEYDIPENALRCGLSPLK
ncbi:hypothetical protein L1987_24538 [Smallanthus sonchifolius]|uniref:Uncharacterized protein n=1 Tax=Smallanthus sonchifolius TaxID=185202 RepID=A0ACB9IK12_9ASTR|nr:hypothetical protein L1987_24538 [Smallanthus sonchifolius]